MGRGHGEVIRLSTAPTPSTTDTRSGHSVHLFERRGQRLLYVPDTPGVVRLDEVSHRLMSLRAQGVSLRECADAVAADHGVEAAQRACREMHLLSRHGVLQRRRAAPPVREKHARLVRRYVRWPSKGIQLFVTEACNLRCRYCYAWHNDALRGPQMPMDVADAAIDFALTRNGNLRRMNITFFGGEPLLNFGLIEHVVIHARERARKLGKRVHLGLVTNGTLVDEEIAAFLKRHRVGVTLSLDGPPEIQNHMRPMPHDRPSFDATMRGARVLQAAGISFLTRATVTPLCTDRMALAAYFERERLLPLQLTCAEGRTEGQSSFDIQREHWPDLRRSDEHVADTILGRLAADRRVAYVPFAPMLSSIHSASSPSLPCGVTRAVTTVGVDGRLYPCHRYVGMDNYVMGDVWSGIDRHVHADYLRRYFEARTRCETCWAAPACNLRCPWYMSCEDGSFLPPAEWRCAEAQEWAERCIWLYGVLAEQHPDYLQRVVGGKAAATAKDTHSSSACAPYPNSDTFDADCH